MQGHQVLIRRQVLTLEINRLQIGGLRGLEISLAAPGDPQVDPSLGQLGRQGDGGRPDHDERLGR